MQSIYGYIRGKQEQEHKKKRGKDIDPYPDTMELEKARELSSSLNRQKSVFDSSQQGLNKTMSVFERTAVFHAGKE